MNKGPIFIAGLERSGTSLIYAVGLPCQHRHDHAPTYGRTSTTNHGDISDPANFERCLSMMIRYKRLLVLEPDRRLCARSTGRVRRPMPGSSPCSRAICRRMGKPHWGDKSLNTERYADPIFDAYPNARMIHMMRDPRDRYASVITRWKVRRGGVGAGTAMWLESVKLARRNQQRYPDRYMILRYETLALQPEETLQTICDFIGNHTP